MFVIYFRDAAGGEAEPSHLLATFEGGSELAAVNDQDANPLAVLFPTLQAAEAAIAADMAQSGYERDCYTIMSATLAQPHAMSLEWREGFQHALYRDCVAGVAEDEVKRDGSRVEMDWEAGSPSYVHDDIARLALRQRAGAAAQLDQSLDTTFSFGDPQQQGPDIFDLGENDD